MSRASYCRYVDEKFGRKYARIRSELERGGACVASPPRTGEDAPDTSSGVHLVDTPESVRDDADDVLPTRRCLFETGLGDKSAFAVR